MSCRGGTLPPCGITLAIKAAGECTSCEPGMYSNEADSAVCKACTDCGSRKVKSSCTAEKNTEYKNQLTIQPTVSPPTTSETAELGQLTPHNPMTLTSTAPTSQPPQLINASSFLSSFAGTIVALVLLGLIGLIIYAVFKLCARKMQKGYKKLSDTSKPEVRQREDKGDIMDENSDNEIGNEEASATMLEDDLNLLDIPQI
ncbi:hypothetical protein OS493_029262 [Desmophyllum pertusum]|uniref:TNFR-Cys domain-containing protein n=1 Tax=Desmophyllum pertusum TaxID=174260 RepID=A0A9W9ZKG6_9CNID|nr:hypothetical protein OS493_029262 [Desmophyllum pertusum]